MSSSAPTARPCGGAHRRRLGDHPRPWPGSTRPAARDRTGCDRHGRAAGSGVSCGQQQVRDHRFALTGGRARGRRLYLTDDELDLLRPTAARSPSGPDHAPAASSAASRQAPATPTPPRPARQPRRSWHRTPPSPPPRTASPRLGCRSPFRPRVSHPVTGCIDRPDTPGTPKPPSRRRRPRRL